MIHCREFYIYRRGFTKALALPTRPIPAMFDFISTSAEYLYDDFILTTLAKLENSGPYPYSKYWSADCLSISSPCYLRIATRPRSRDAAIIYEN